MVSYALILWGFAQTDLAVAQFIRTVHLPWLERAGDFGGRLGNGWTLVLISAALLAVGVAGGRRSFREAGVQSLVSHGAAGLSALLFKLLAGRPRPRLTHGDPFQFGPALESGLDSLPSGHATASFAVAAVLARHFPGAAWPCYGLAGFVAMSRVVRGSHFPTDVALGAMLGLVIGLLVSVPLGSKWRAIRSGVVALTTGLALVFTLSWVALHPAPHEAVDQETWLVGLPLFLGAAGARVARTLLGLGPRPWLPTLPAAFGLMALGLGVSTGLPLLAGLGGLVGTTTWLAMRAPAGIERPPGAGCANPARPPSWRPAEFALLLGLGILFVALQALQGVLPLLSG